MPTLELMSLYVERNHRGTGVAAALLRRALRHEPAHLWIFRDNNPAGARPLRQARLRPPRAARDRPRHRARRATPRSLMTNRPRSSPSSTSLPATVYRHLYKIAATETETETEDRNVTNPSDLRPISGFSIRSLYLELLAPTSAVLSGATGFLVHGRHATPYLITNRHVVTGRHQDTGKPLSCTAATPEAITIYFNARGRGGLSWVGASMPLYTEAGRPVWLEHPQHGSAVDVVAIPVHGDTSGLDLDTVHLLYEDLQVTLRPAVDLQVIGFPVGAEPHVDHGAFAVWSRGNRRQRTALGLARPSPLPHRQPHSSWPIRVPSHCLHQRALCAAGRCPRLPPPTVG